MVKLKITLPEEVIKALGVGEEEVSSLGRFTLVS